MRFAVCNHYPRAGCRHGSQYEMAALEVCLELGRTDGPVVVYYGHEAARRVFKGRVDYYCATLGLDPERVLYRP